MPSASPSASFTTNPSSSSSTAASIPGVCSCRQHHLLLVTASNGVDVQQNLAADGQPSGSDLVRLVFSQKHGYGNAQIDASSAVDMRLCKEGNKFCFKPSNFKNLLEPTQPRATLACFALEAAHLSLDIASRSSAQGQVPVPFETFVSHPSQSTSRRMVLRTETVAQNVVLTSSRWTPSFWVSPKV